MRRTKTLIAIMAIAVVLSCALWAARASADNGSPISYHAGPVMTGSTDVYVIWYGSWVALTGPNSLDTQNIINSFLAEIGGSPRFGINNTYPNGSGSAPTNILLGGSRNASSAHGLDLTPADIQTLVQENIGFAKFPLDPNGIYIVIASSDVGSDATGLCSPNQPPFHSSFAGGGQQVRYAFIGNAARCPNVLAPQFLAPNGSQLPTPNGNLAADAMVSTILHVLETTITDPDHTGWFDGFGLENADKCAGSFSQIFTLANGARANFSYGTHSYLLQDNWVNNYGGYCSRYNDAPPRPDNQTIQVNQDTAKSMTLTGVDDNGDPMTFNVVTPPQHGTLTGSGANRTYTPASNFHGPDSFTYKANDGTLDSVAPATVTINVNTNAALDGFDPNANGLVRTALVQPDGKILIGGDFTTLAPNGRVTVTRNYVARLNPDGTVDPAFNPSANSSVHAIALQPDGKIILAGDFSTLAPNGGPSINCGSLARFNADGTIDGTFNPRANGSVRAVALQADGGIVVGGEFQNFFLNGGTVLTRNRIARVNPNGAIDPVFNPNANSAVDTLALQPDGRILIGGRFTSLSPNGGTAVPRSHLARLNVDGTLDTPFNPNPDNDLGAIALQPDGKILIGGAFVNLTPNGGTLTPRNHMARLNGDGSLDQTFNPSPNGFVQNIVLQADGKILIGGGFNSLTPNGGSLVVNKFIARLNPDGTLNPGVNPSPNGEVFAIAVQPDGKIVVGGVFAFASSFGGQARNRIARLEVDGAVDQTLNINTVGGQVSASAVQPDGKILIGGSFTSILGVARKNIARLNSDGTLDITFNPGANDFVSNISVQPDGKILVGGYFTSFAPNGGPSVARSHMARLNRDGTVDTGFDPGPNNNVATIALQPDGKILLGGSFTGVRPKLARLNGDGTLDSAFSPGPNNDVYSIVLQADGKILVAGQFTQFTPAGRPTTLRNYVARLNSDGTVDSTFDPHADQTLYALAAQPDGKILVGGFFTAFAPNGGASVPRSFLARLNVDGTVDNSFNPNPDGWINAVALQADGKVLVAGAFTTLTPSGGTSVTRSYFARLNSDGTVDAALDPAPDDGVATITTQADGKILAGGSFQNIGGQARSLFARLANDTAAIQNLSVTPTNVTWTRSGAAPPVWRVSFERSTDGVNYTFMGNGTRIGASSNFTLTGQSLPVQQNIFIRARGFYRQGYVDGSESITDSVRNVFLPPTAHLAFAQQPVNTSEGRTITPAVTVQILDASNNLINSTAAVTLEIGTNPSAGTLNGIRTVAAVGGTATFNSLSIDKAGNGYTLAASGTNLTGAISSLFDVTARVATNIEPFAGAGQSATINTTFAAPLAVTVFDPTGQTMSGVIVTFTAPSSGPGGTFAGQTIAASALTNGQGVATAPAFTANGLAGAYSVNASINGGSASTGLSLTNNKASQVISINAHAPAAANNNSQFTVAAVSSSGLPVSYSSTGSCANNGATFTMTSATGNCTVKYDQAGDANRNPAPSITETVSAKKAAQTVTLDAIAEKVFGDADFAGHASATSGLDISFASSGNCTNSGGTIHLTGAGSCTITASQAGNELYDAAPNVTRSFNIAKAGQSITFDAVPDKTFGDADFLVSASVNSGLALSIAATGQCSIAEKTVHLNGAGSCTLTASQAGDANYDSASGVSRSFQIAKASTLTQLSYSSEAGKGDHATLAATVSSSAGMPSGTVTFMNDGAPIQSCSAVAMTSGSASCVASAIPAGLHTFTAEYSGDGNFNTSTGSVVGGQTGNTIQFSQATYVVAERGGSIAITVQRTGDVSGAASVDYLTDDGSVASVTVPCALANGVALERCDYTRADGTLTFAANETEKSFVILVNDDSYVEGMETVSLRLANPEGGALGPQATATLQITDDGNESLSNPVDDNANFVRQSYHDFLNREPDTEGFNFWTNNIALCDSDGCNERKRVDTSAAFFLSIEFQETGYLVERFYKAAYGDANGNSTLGGAHQLAVPSIRLREFLHDTQEIGQGVIVNQAGWQQQLENRKQAFAREFVSRERFRSAYPDSLNAEQFVNQLNANTGSVLTDAEVAQLESVFGGANASTVDSGRRAQVLRSFAENQILQQREFNRAFVLMQYFGYLRRNPNDAQDADYTGYDFWLRKLDQFGGNYLNAEMVRAFIESSEYRQRFGQ